MTTGAFIGGAIAPGVSHAAGCPSRENRSKLPLRQTGKAGRATFGRSTEQAIRQGVFHGIRGMVKEIVEQFAVELGTWPDIIATGGDSPVLFGDWELAHAVSTDLTLYGIALAYTNHYIKHER